MTAQLFRTLQNKATDTVSCYDIEVDAGNIWTPIRLTMKWGEAAQEILYEDTARSCMCQGSRMPRTCCSKEDYVYAQECFGMWVCPFVLAPTLDLIITEWEKEAASPDGPGRSLGNALTLETLQTRRTRPQDLEPHWRPIPAYLHPHLVNARRLRREAEQNA